MRMLTPDKRDHYRLADHIQVKYRHVSRQDTLAGSPERFFKGSSIFPILKELYRLDLEARETLRGMSKTDKETADFLANLNQRVVLLGQAMRVAEGEPTQFDAPARISQGGISFIGDELIPAGSLLALRLSFRDSLIALAAYAEVRHCRLAEDGERYVVGARFESLDTGDEKLIQRYIIHRQAADRRSRLRSH